VPHRIRAWLVPDRPSEVAGGAIAAPARRGTHLELLIVFAVTLGMSGLRSLLSLLDSLLKTKPLNHQHVALNTATANNSVLDLFGQLAGVLQLLAWGALGIYLLWRSGIGIARIGLDRDHPGRDLLGGAGLAALIGIPGLAFYFATRALGINLTVLPSTLADHWWRIPILIGSAIANAWAEEALVIGYLITTLRRLGRRENNSLVTAAVLRGSYHLYQGFGGFLGNIVMGLVFGRVWQRTNRLWVLVVAHSILDIASFVGYTLLSSHISLLR
jgi:hypothetical protein